MGGCVLASSTISPSSARKVLLAASSTTSKERRPLLSIRTCARSMLASSGRLVRYRSSESVTLWRGQVACPCEPFLPELRSEGKDREGRAGSIALEVGGPTR